MTLTQIAPGIYACPGMIIEPCPEGEGCWVSTGGQRVHVPRTSEEVAGELNQGQLTFKDGFRSGWEQAVVKLQALERGLTTEQDRRTMYWAIGHLLDPTAEQVERGG